jgi:alpha/beta superfamily hydrolase
MQQNLIFPRNSRKIFIKGPVGLLDCLVIEPSELNYKAIALIFHPDPKGGGNYTNKIVQIIAKTLVQEGYLCVCPNLRGVGDSEGIHDMGIGEIDDAKAIYEHYKNEYPNLSFIYAGFSFGTSIASQLSTFYKPKHLFLVGPAITRYKVSIVDKTITTVIHGELDEIVDIDSVLEWSRDNDLPIIWCPKVGHFFHGKLNMIQDILNKTYIKI